MAAGTLPRPGSVLGPCSGACNHTDCAQIRQQAAEPCQLCGEAIGYDKPFVLYGQGYAHERCQVKKIEAERQAPAVDPVVAQIAVDIAKVTDSYALVNTAKVVWEDGTFYIVGDEPHVYVGLKEVAFWRDHYVKDHNNQHIQAFKLVPVEPAELAKAYAAAVAEIEEDEDAS